MENKRSMLLVRLLLGLIVGAIVAAISIYIAWYNNVVEHYNEYLCREQMVTRWRLEYLDQTVKEYIQKSNSLPQSLEQAIDASTNGISYAEPLTDGWHHPFQYSVTGPHCIITSYGADNKPGGIGINCDLANKNPRPKERKMTFPQFLKAPAARGMVNCSIICGFAAALICISGVKTTQLSDHPVTSLVFRLFATVIAATILAIMITGLHVPSGH